LRETIAAVLRYEISERRQACVALERRQQIRVAVQFPEEFKKRTLTESVYLPDEMLEPRGWHATRLCRQAIAVGLEPEERLAGGVKPAHERIGLARSARASHRNIDRRGLSVEGRLGHFLGSPLMKGSREDLTFTVAIG
jgi:hypothetical protein